MDAMVIFICGVLIIICSIIAYRFGYNKDKNIQIVNKEQVESQQAARISKLDQQINDLNKNIYDKEQRIHSLDEEYNRAKQLIQDASESAERAYTSRTEQLQKEYQELNKQLEENKQMHVQTITDELYSLNQELNSLKQTKAATIEALQKEKFVQEQKDMYRLNISKQDSEDIGFLRSIQYRISKPRLISMLIWQNYYQGIAKQKFPKILGSDTVCGIYKITNQTNQMVYIGQARDMRKRWMDHCKCGLDIDRPQGNKLYAAMVEDGLENFTFELIEECAQDKLNEKEQYYIELYNAIEYGYNGRNQK